MISGFFFICWRIGQMFTLIPPIGILAWFVDGFVKANILTPTYILLLFIVSVLGGVWALETLLRHNNTKRSGKFVGAIDLCFVGAFIAGVYQLRHIATASCGNFDRNTYLLSLGPFGFYGQRADHPLSRDTGKLCAMLKTAFAFGILNTLSFFVTAGLAFMMDESDERPRRSRRSSHSSRRGHRHHRSRSGGRGAEYHV